MNENKYRVLVIEDEAPIRRFLRTTLVASGYEFFEACCGQDGIESTAVCNPDVVIIDLGLPDIDGLEVVRVIREWSQVPILILSAREKEGDKVEALDLGADDYLTKPFGVPELLARMRAAMRRAAAIEDRGLAVFQIGEVTVEHAKRIVHRNGDDIHLTPIEYKLLFTLLKYRGRVLTHNQLLKEVWGPGYREETQYLRVYIAQLRKKLESDAANPKHLLTEPGVGYRLKEDNTAIR